MTAPRHPTGAAPQAFAAIRRALSPGSAVIFLLAVLSTAGVCLLETRQPDGITYWLFSEAHFKVYQPIVTDWNRTHPDKKVDIAQLNILALERRMLTGFLADTPVADIMGVERPLAAKTFIGPIESVGFADLTDRLQASGIFQDFSPSSLTPWTSRGRVFGAPLDIHPVLLGYRADLVETAGIDLSKVETWDDYFAAMKPLMKDLDGDGRPDRWLLNLWDTNMDLVLMILRQADGALFDANNQPCLNLPRNAEVLARLVTWFTGPKRVCADVELYTASGHKQRLDGVVVASLLPDWMSGQWKLEMPALAGKVQVMPLPAWERGGRRTSVWRGGTMLGLNKKSPRLADAWAFVRHLAISTELAEDLYRRTNIVPPNTSLWKLKVFDEPDSYYRGQPVGRLYLDQAADVPVRSSSPFAMSAQVYVGNALVLLRAHADETGTFDEQALRPVAQRLLDEAQRRLAREIQRNTFLAPAS